MIDSTILNAGSGTVENLRTASITPLSALRRGSDDTRRERIEPQTNFDTAVRCVIANAYILASPLIDSSADSALKKLARLIDDPVLLSEIAAHPDRPQLCQLLLSFVIAESARGSLWHEVEELLAIKTNSPKTR